MSRMRELFHGISNHLNVISTVSFTLSDAIECQSDTGIDKCGMREKIDGEIGVIEEACRFVRGDIEVLATMILDKLGLKNETGPEFVGIFGELGRMESLLVKVKGVVADGADLLKPLADELCLFEKNCFDLAKLLKGLKATLIRVGKYGCKLNNQEWGGS